MRRLPPLWPCGGSLAAAALSAEHDTVDEVRLVGTNVPNLSTLAGARSGTVGAALRARRQWIELQPLETRMSRGAIAYFKVEKPRFLFLEGSAGAVVAAAVATTALTDASVARAGASAARAVSSTDRPTAGASVPALGACSFAASAALDKGGGRVPPLRGACPLS
jgi:hypothetical protein